MKRFLSIIVSMIISLIAINVVAQTIEQVKGVPKNETKKERKAREKKLKALADSVAYIEAENAIDSNYFVITADRLSLGRGGYMISAPDPTTNFVMVQGDDAIVQIAFNNGNLGLNGLGGITVEGKVSGSKKSIDKKGNIDYSFSVMGVSISAQISITVFASSNSASVFISPNFNSHKMTLYGSLIPYDHKGEKKAHVGTMIP